MKRTRENHNHTYHNTIYMWYDYFCQIYKKAIISPFYIDNSMVPKKKYNIQIS